MEAKVKNEPYICPHCGKPHNRHERRSSKHEGNYPAFLRPLKDAIDYQKELAPIYDAANKDSLSISLGAYRDHLPIYQFQQAAKAVNTALRDVKHLQDPTGIISLGIRVDTFGRKVNGISLTDIEAMEMPLSRGDIGRINRFLKNHRFTGHTIQERFSQQVALTLATVAFARSNFLDSNKNAHPPQELQSLQSRMSNYLDSFYPLFTSPYVNDADLFSFIGSWGSDTVSRSLGFYVPARLGISPASAIKITRNSLDQVPLFPFFRDKFLAKMEGEADNAFRPDSLPDHLHRYLRYNPQADQEASAQLYEHYKTGAFSPDIIEQLAEKFTPFQRPLLRDIRDHKKELQIKVPEGFPVERIIVTCQYTQTLMYILMLRNGAHITLEVSDGRLYGVPGALSKEIPHISEMLMQDLLSLGLNFASTRYQLEKSPVTEIKPLLPKPIITSAILQEKNMDVIVPEVRIIEPRPKSVTLLQARSLIPQFIQKEQEVPTRQTRERRFTVNCTRAELLNFLGKTTPDHVVDQIMRDILRFEYGEKQISQINEGEDLFRLRSGNYRVIFKFTGQNSFTVDRVGNRKDVYQ